MEALSTYRQDNTSLLDLVGGNSFEIILASAVFIIVYLFSIYKRPMLKHFTFECRGNLSSNNILTVQVMKQNIDIANYSPLNLKITDIVLDCKQEIRKSAFVGVTCNKVTNTYNQEGRVIMEKPFLATGEFNRETFIAKKKTC